MPLEYVKGAKLWLKNHPRFDEAWIRDCVARDPSLLGLGRTRLLAVERTQTGAGRLDLLLETMDSARRYVVELMLGRVDESHIVRCIEYWDIERRRCPRVEHVAVLAAEDMTSRFLNVLTLIRQVVPVVALQMEAIRVGQQVLLNFVRILDEPVHAEDPDRTLARAAEEARHAVLTRELLFPRKPPQSTASPRAGLSLSSTASPGIRPPARKSRTPGRY
ncbi:MAG: hypothetical protein L0099_12475 [Acidobacteria bacterium]|nr:hypothetical protein [Acidobacteriota bacterium]